jgi:hypothetical protein
MNVQHKLVELLQRRPELWNDLYPLIADQAAQEFAVETGFIRLHWGPNVIQFEELPQKPVNPDVRLRRLKVDLHTYVDQGMDRFQGGIVILEGKITPELTYDQAVSRLKDHLQTVATDYSTDLPTYAEDYYEIEDVQPATEEPLNATGGNFQVTATPEDFRFHSPHQEGLYADPAIINTDPEGAEKMFNILSGDGTFFHSFSWEEVPPWLVQTKINYKFVYK